MAKQRNCRSLTFKLLAMLLLAAGLALASFFLTVLLGQTLIRRVYMTPERVQARAEADIASFRAYVAGEKVLSTDVAAIGAWNRSHPYVRLTISGRELTINSDSSGAEVVLSNSALTVRTGEGTRYEYAVNFSDGTYTVGVYNFSQTHLASMVQITAVCVAALLFLLVSILYDRRVTRTIQRLSRQVRRVSQGELETAIVPQTRDEIGDLAADVDTMRRSILQKLQAEQEAWRANSQLITAISHDVRTPLTALMGYLDVLTVDNLSQEDRRAYLEVCRHNAGRLKDLTDELFRFFLVFGQSQPDQEPEDCDAAMLLGQILVEAQAELMQQGYDVRLESDPELSGTIRVDIGHLRRVFDNLFSNVRKYADPERPVTVRLSCREGGVQVSVANFVRAASQAESTKIGLKTCEKLMQAMGGSFTRSQEAGLFTAELTLPLAQET